MYVSKEKKQTVELIVLSVVVEKRYDGQAADDALAIQDFDSFPSHLYPFASAQRLRQAIEVAVVEYGRKESDVQAHVGHRARVLQYKVVSRVVGGKRRTCYS